jgi:putative hydrolase of the HAD superfamily
VRAVLFDADGVIQRPAPHRRSLWAQLLRGLDADVDAFVQDAFSAERDCLSGDRDFIHDFGSLLIRWNASGVLADALKAWTAIEVDHGVLEIIKLLRASGYGCYLASNQEPYRAQYMSETLGYRAAFDAEFYSCRLGFAKPDKAYFQAILRALAVVPDTVLFIDDHIVNVEAARHVGLRASVFAPAQDESWPNGMRALLASHGLVVSSSPRVQV